MFSELPKNAKVGGVSKFSNWMIACHTLKLFVSSKARSVFQCLYKPRKRKAWILEQPIQSLEEPVYRFIAKLKRPPALNSTPTLSEAYTDAIKGKRTILLIVFFLNDW